MSEAESQMLVVLYILFTVISSGSWQGGFGLRKLDQSEGF